MTPVAAAALAGALALVGRAIGWLTPGGTLAAAVTGTVVFAGGGLTGAALLALLFVSGSALTYQTAGAKMSKPHTKRRGRTARQVLANGFWPAVGALVVVQRPEPGWGLLTGALAAAQADTWSTEIGAYSTRLPRLITYGRLVPRGTSGGVTPLGTIAGCAGAAAMAGLALSLGLPLRAAGGALVGGIAGMLADSLLGARVQGVYYCETCSIENETPNHSCGHCVRHIRGWPLMGNNAVNLVATGIGALVSVAIWYWL